MLEMSRLNKKQTKIIEKAVEVIDELLCEDSHYVPSFKSLQRMKMDYDPYIYSNKLLE